MNFPCEVLESYTRITAAGAYSTDDVCEMLDCIADLSPAGYPLLVDGRETRHNPSVFELKDIAERVYVIRNHIGNRAALVVEEGVKFGIARMLQALGDANKLEFRVFLDIDQAHAWLSARS